MQVFFCGTGWLSIVDVLRRRLPSDVTLRVRDPRLPLVEQIRDADVLLPSNAHLDAATIAVPRRLLLVQQPAVGIEAIDLDAARARGVPVCNAPGSNEHSVAETALFLMLALARRFPRAQRAFAERTLGEPRGLELRGRTLCIIGLGRTGSALARAAEALGMRVVAVLRATPWKEALDLAASADVISVHCPLTPRTRGLVGAELLSRVKPGAFLVNVARGPVVDRDALEHALTSGKLGGAGLDVFWEEPWDPADPLYHRDDVVVLPHVAGSTEEAYARIADIVASNVERLLRGEPLLHRIV